MPKNDLAVIILAAGEGTRMKSKRAKVLFPLAGRAMLGHVLETAAKLDPARIIVVAGKNRGQLEDYLHAGHFQAEIAIQDRQKGTGHAVQCAKEHLKGFRGDVLVLNGDGPLIRAKTLQDLLRKKGKKTLGMIGFETENPARYGRMVRNSAGNLEKIVEFADASEKEKKITFCNSGVLAAHAEKLFSWLGALKNDNAKGEYYLTDIVSLAGKNGETIPLVEGTEKEFQGVNTKKELASAEGVLQERLREAAMEKGAILIDPGSVNLSHDTQLGKDVTVWPHVVFGPGVTVEEGATIHSFSHLEDCRVGKEASIGPYARLRPGADIKEGAKIGNFVEIKKATVEKGAKVNHLSYIGDARVGEGANIGAGTITCNYDGFAKHFTDIGPGAFIGSNVALVAPVKIGKGAIVGAGSVITKKVDDEALATARAKQEQKDGGAKALRRKKKG